MLIVELWWLAYLQAMGSSETVVAYIFASRGSQSVKEELEHPQVDTPIKSELKIFLARVMLLIEGIDILLM